MAHQCSFPYSTFQINDSTGGQNDLFKNFLTMLDMGDVRDDLTEHFGVVGDRIVGSFRSQPSYLRYTESDCLINPHQPPSQVITASRFKDRSSYGTYSSSRSSSSSSKPALSAIGHNQSNYRIAKIEENEPESPTRNQNTSVSSTMTQSTASASSSSFGINVRGLENDPINYRNPNV